MKLNKFIPKKNVAQAMVEFAIVLPILLLLLYGLLEVGRLLFMYTTVINAGRQAVRYGSATGIGTGTVLRYQDCTGIRLAANKADYLNAFNHETDDVKIFWDNGPTDAVADRQICTVGTVSSSWTPTNESRLLVYVEGHFNPLVKLVPLPQRNIKSTSARTILVSISIAVTAPGSGGGATGSPTVTGSPTATGSPTLTFTASPTLLYTYTPSFTPRPADTGTAAPPATATFTPTTIPTPVLNCNTVRDSFQGAKNPIKLSGNTMYLDVPNTNPYPITVDHVYLAWNYKGGHNSPFNADLRLIGAQFPTGNVFWTGNIHAPIYTIPYPYSPPVVIPAGATSRLTFLFDQSYDISKKEEVEIYFSTPGCESFPVVVKN